MKPDVADVLVVIGALMLGVGLWLTVGWWALVVMGALALLFGAALALRGPEVR